MMWNGWTGSYGWGMGGFGLLHLVWWLVLVVGVVALVRWAVGRGGARTGDDRAVAILRERYARGEIDQAEFEERIRHLDAPGMRKG